MCIRDRVNTRTRHRHRMSAHPAQPFRRSRNPTIISNLLCFTLELRLNARIPGTRPRKAARQR
eukprot:6422867-Alexandrium_andersonii.AAC.1